MRPRRPLQAGAVPSLNWLLLVCPGGHRTPHPRNVYQVKLCPWAKGGRRRGGKSPCVPPTWMPGGQTLLACPTVPAMRSLPCLGRLQKPMALAVRSRRKPSPGRPPGAACVHDSRWLWRLSSLRNVCFRRYGRRLGLWKPALGSGVVGTQVALEASVGFWFGQREPSISQAERTDLPEGLSIARKQRWCQRPEQQACAGL